MTQEWDFDAPRDALLPLATLAAAFPGGIVPVVVADFAATYHIPDPASHHFPLLVCPHCETWGRTTAQHNNAL